ncbi:MAG: dipicolinate synthase subunit B [Oscillospiraceae bacterium]
MSLSGVKIGFGMCGSFCTFQKAFSAAKELTEQGAEVYPIMSFNASGISTRFGTATDNRTKFESICNRQIINTIEDAEPIGPKKMFDILIVAPCTANTLAKLSVGISDTPVTMAVKSHLRNGRPVAIAVSTNDALAGSAKNIGMLQNYKNYYFVPYSQDNYQGKPNSLVADFTKIKETVEYALEGKQIQPIIIT